MDRDLRRMGRAELLEMLIASAKEKEALESQKQEYSKQAEEAKNRAADSDVRLTTVQEQLTAARAELGIQAEKASAVQEQLASLQEQLESARNQLNCAQEELTKEREQAAQLQAVLREKEEAVLQAQAKIDSLTQQISDRVIVKENAGTLADAAIQINGVLAAAQRAADQYLENVERMHAEQERVCAAMEAESREKAEQILREAEVRCAMLEEQTRQKCAELKSSAEKNVWQKWSSLSEQLQQISTEIRNSVNTSDKG